MSVIKGRWADSEIFSGSVSGTCTSAAPALTTGAVFQVQDVEAMAEPSEQRTL
jgi:hypothetical protein